MDKSQLLLGSPIGDPVASAMEHFPFEALTLISAIEEGEPNSATYTLRPFPVWLANPRPARYDHAEEYPFSRFDTQPFVRVPLVLSKKAAVIRSPWVLLM